MAWKDTGMKGRWGSKELLAGGNFRRRKPEETVTANENIGKGSKGRESRRKVYS